MIKLRPSVSHLSLLCLLFLLFFLLFLLFHAIFLSFGQTQVQGVLLLLHGERLHLLQIVVTLMTDGLEMRELGEGDMLTEEYIEKSRRRGRRYP